MLAFITGSGLYDHDTLEYVETRTRFGSAGLYKGVLNGREVLMLPRHGEHHKRLPHQVNHLANFLALRQLGADAVVSCSVCGVLNPDWDIGIPLVANDVYFPDNRLGDGKTCSLFQETGEPDRGHLLAQSLIHADMAADVTRLTDSSTQGVYGHVPGPRFNTPVEIRALQAAGVDFISQTCGPEAVLANELELPYVLAGFAVDYANGVKNEPTPVETLNENLSKGRECFLRLIQEMAEPDGGYDFRNFVYRFEGE